MSLYDKATLVQIPSGYKASSAKLYSVIPSDGDGDFTVSADADATRVNAEGLIEDTAANQARLSRNFIDGELQSDPFLLLEPTRRNLFLNSEDFTNGSWNKTRTTITGNQTTAPNGTNNADLLTGDGTGTSYVFDGVFLYTATYYISIFVKNINGNDFTIQNFTQAGTAVFDLTDGTVTSTSGTMSDAKIEQYPNDWFRVSAKITSTLGGANANLGFGVKNYNGEQFYIWGAQVEDNASGGSVSYISSYIPTTSASVTRTADSCKLQPFSGLTTDYPLTVYGKIEIQEKFAHFISIGNSTSQFEYLSVSTGTGGVNVFRRNVNNDEDFYAFSYSIGDIIKFAIKYTSNTAYKLYINGSLIGNVTSGLNIDFDFDSVLLGQLRNSDTLRNPVYEAMIFNEALSDSELIALTS